MQKYILASASPRRKELLSFVLDNYEIIPANIDETQNEKESPTEYVKRMAKEKAQKIFNENKNSTIIGCDTVVWLDKQIFPKPKNEDDAKRILTALSGKAHNVTTAVAIIDKNKYNIFEETTKVEFFELEDKQINDYISFGEGFDKAGSYAIQGKGALFVKSICGDYFNVVGLPVAKLARKLQHLIN